MTSATDMMMRRLSIEDFSSEGFSTEREAAIEFPRELIFEGVFFCRRVGLELMSELMRTNVDCTDSTDDSADVMMILFLISR
jgi:hypothetical protein